MVKENKKNGLSTPSVLAFERKLSVSDGMMSGGVWDKRADERSWKKLEIHAKSVRGTISNRMKAKDASDPAKIDAKVSNPNLQTVDVCQLPFEADTLCLSFTLRVLGGLDRPSACNSPEYGVDLAHLVAGYQQTHGFGALACRYAQNLASGRFLWRNRVGAEALEIRVTHSGQAGEPATWVFDGHDPSLNRFDTPAALQPLADAIAAGLAGEANPFFQVQAFARLGKGQEVFPSQELILNRGDQEKSKTLYAVAGQAAMHSQKIGNALRTIDDWYPESQSAGPIAVEPYGSVTSLGRAYRQPKAKMDFYSLLDQWMIKGQVPEVAQQHYVMAVLVRGGVFGEKGDE